MKGYGDAQGRRLGWKDGTEGLWWQGEAAGGWREDRCPDYGAGVCEPESADGGGEDGASVGVVCGDCRGEYGANGCDLHARRCPVCQGGVAEEALREAAPGLFGYGAAGGGG